ncbi:hypothetical protein YC2023_097181 [Brassica napus]
MELNEEEGMEVKRKRKSAVLRMKDIEATKEIGKCYPHGKSLSDRPTRVSECCIKLKIRKEDILKKMGVTSSLPYFTPTHISVTQYSVCTDRNRSSLLMYELADFPRATVGQGFISSNWVVRHQGNLNCGTIYQLMNFFATKANTSIYRVVDDNLTIHFTHSSVLSELQDNPVVIQRDRFRFHSFQEFEANCDLQGDLCGKLTFWC